jgi:3-deoxy-D-arabino-heptulosonate 7-phosphate (DAHP) synthase class II
MQSESGVWSPSSWRSKEILQQPDYQNQDALKEVLAKVSSLPPIVHYQEVDALKQELARAGRGESFLLQVPYYSLICTKPKGGDCAERFQDCTKDAIEAKFKILLQMSMVIIWGSSVPVVRVARMAGQFAKPRSSPTETLPDGSVVFSFKGDNVNSFSPGEREPDPNR